MTDATVQALINVFPRIIPECILVAFACALYLGGTFKACRRTWGIVALVGIVAAGIALAFTKTPTFQSEQSALSALYAGPVWLDQVAILTKWIALVGGAILILLSWNDVPDDHAGDLHGSLLVIVAGLCFTAGANDLVVLFIALELVSIPTYVILYLLRSDKLGQEAGVKYFLLSIFSSALLLFGFSYLYGLAGTTNLQGILSALAGPDSSDVFPPVQLIAIVMVIAGLGFKITAVPFHFYAPDVYQGTTNSGAALLSFVPKVAGFLALIRLLGLVPFYLPLKEGSDLPAYVGGGPLARAQISILLWILAAVTMTLGNVLALLQDNVRRLFAYSSVAHAGYMLIGLAIAPYVVNEPSSGVDAILFYLASYGAMTIGVFAIVSHLSSKARPVENVDDLSGLSTSNPRMALLMALFMFSLIGMPATAGFMGKFLLFYDAFTVPKDVYPGNLFRILVLIGAINAAIGAWYYLRIIAVMYLRTSLRPLDKPRRSMSLAAIWVCIALTIGLGVYPRLLTDPARKATSGKVKTAFTADDDAGGGQARPVNVRVGR